MRGMSTIPLIDRALPREVITQILDYGVGNPVFESEAISLFSYVGNNT